MDIESPDEDALEASLDNNFINDIPENYDIGDEYADEEDTPESRLLSCAKTGNAAEMKALLSSAVIDANAISEREAASQG